MEMFPGFVTMESLAAAINLQGYTLEAREALRLHVSSLPTIPLTLIGGDRSVSGTAGDNDDGADDTKAESGGKDGKLTLLRK